MAKPRRSETQVGTPSTRGSRARPEGQVERLRPATRALSDVLAERGPLTGPITDAGTKALLAMRGEETDGGHGRR
jgi:hypothetical protein